MSTVKILPTPGFRIRYKRYARNGAYPHSEFQTNLSVETNKLVRYRTKNLASFSQHLQDGFIATSTGSYPVWRFAFHSSPYVSRIGWVVWVKGRAGGEFVTAGAARLRIQTGTPTTIGDSDITVPVISATLDDVPSSFHEYRGYIKSGGAIVDDVPANTALYGTISTEDACTILAACVFEESLLPDTSNGYALDNYAGGSPVYDLDRHSVTTMLRDSWKYGSAPLYVFSFTGDDTYYENTTTTAQNVLTSALLASPGGTAGPTLNLENASTVRRASSGVPVVFKVYASRTVSNGTVTLMDSGGATVLTISVTGTAAWYSTTGYLPDEEDSYTVFGAAGASGTLIVRAVSLYPYEA